ncbi:MAG: LPS export ABC transporter periplasmic protein LptC [Nitrospirae bacterium]|nr:LPS export ABC transporter periplasmic protein LptC [Candidatus Troglogloeales bacterium]MBI3598038.1 LPS export ABC transporter periplasmic protein LptC [Candidatus Troglogloeales bacterium]
MGFFGGVYRTGLVLLGGVLIFVSVLVFFFGLKQKPQEVLPRLEEWADLSLSGISLVETRHGVKEWELQAQHAQLFEKDQTAVLKKIVVIMKTQNGVPLTISGDNGKMDMEGKSFSIQNERTPLSITWGNGYIIKTARLHWSSEEKVVQTDGEVAITGSGMFIRGDRFKIFLDRSELTVLGNVHAQVY